jgi:hypothetical protein
MKISLRFIQIVFILTLSNNPVWGDEIEVGKAEKKQLLVNLNSPSGENCQFSPTQLTTHLETKNHETIKRLVECYTHWGLGPLDETGDEWDSGAAWVVKGKKQVGWVSSCGYSPYHGQFLVFDTSQKVLHIDNPGCITEVTLEDLNGDDVSEFIVNTVASGTGITAYIKHIYFYRDRYGFNKGNKVIVESNSSELTLESLDGRQIMDTIQEFRKQLNFLDQDKDGFKETLEITETRIVRPGKNNGTVSEWAKKQALVEYGGPFNKEIIISKKLYQWSWRNAYDFKGDIQ